MEKTQVMQSLLEKISDNNMLSKKIVFEEKSEKVLNFERRLMYSALFISQGKINLVLKNADDRVLVPELGSPISKHL